MKIPAQRGLSSGQPVYLFAKVSGDTVTAGIAILSDASTLSNSFLSR